MAAAWHGVAANKQRHAYSKHRITLRRRRQARGIALSTRRQHEKAAISRHKPATPARCVTSAGAGSISISSKNMAAAQAASNQQKRGMAPIAAAAAGISGKKERRQAKAKAEKSQQQQRQHGSSIIAATGVAAS